MLGYRPCIWLGIVKECVLIFIFIISSTQRFHLLTPCSSIQGPVLACACPPACRSSPSSQTPSSEDEVEDCQETQATKDVNASDQGRLVGDEVGHGTTEVDICLINIGLISNGCNHKAKRLVVTANGNRITQITLTTCKCVR